MHEQIEGRKRELQARFETEKRKVVEPIEQRLKQLQDLSRVADSAKERMKREKDNFIKAQAAKGTEQIKKAIKLPRF